ncbi:MAG TPA: sugar phosphate nucleotidyltransferase [Candidatus Bathyarchaeia archaeon]|nr:sugar phosphate nucleotidyltransferase [Candidatus Bathyarchaeia archaeon]
MGEAQKIDLNCVVFAGGVGTRMWPLSRVETPKQFEKMVNNKSTVQLTVARLRPEITWSNIYISTGLIYASLVKKQLPRIPERNIIGEPQMRDVAGPVGLLSAIIARKDENKPMAILWSDHVMHRVDLFKKVLQVGSEYIRKNPDKILFLGQKPRFANQNLGWIRTGNKINEIGGLEIFKFRSWKYRPTLKLAQKFFKKKDYAWNPGYFIATPKFILDQYKKFMPQMYKKICFLKAIYGTPAYGKQLAKIYPTFEKISFDDAILEKLEPNKAIVVSVDFGWSDLGTWIALKEALQKTPKDNVTKGQTFVSQCEDCLIYNYTNQLVTTINLSKMIVVNTGDVLLVTTKESMSNIKDIVNHFKTGEKYKKYT